MNCPYCQAELSELAAECPGCRLNLNRVYALLGAVPRLEPDLTDHCETLDKRERRKILRQLRALRERFPQLDLQVLCRHFPDEHPFAVYAFWIHNLGGISREQEKAGHNHSVLLILDPVARKSALTVGYGLEPFVSRSELDELLDRAAPAWTDRAWAEGILTVLEGLGSLLETAIRRTGDTFDLDLHPDVARAGDY
jgi:uncharacterized membrane protein YgcG